MINNFIHKGSGELFRKIYDKFQKEIEGYPSAVKREKAFIEFLKIAQPKIVIEIGTCLGISASLIAQYADKVYTFDTTEHPIKYEIWDYLGIRHKIEAFIIKSNEEKAGIISKIEFDFAYIDGDHRREGVEFDFDCVKNKCGKLLFDDYNASLDVTTFINQIDGYKKCFNPKSYFAYLEKL